MPDFFRGKPFPHEDFPPSNEEKQKDLQDFFGTQGDFAARKPDIDAIIRAIQESGGKKLGLLGFCWGGKFAVLNGGEGTKFSAVAQVHPAMVSAADAEKLAIPIANFPSMDEPKEDVKRFEEQVQKKAFAASSVYKLYPDSHHGWAAARADLKDETNLRDYQDVYQRLADFYNRTLA
jgi:dienelactone hydrolase